MNIPFAKPPIRGGSNGDPKPFTVRVRVVAAETVRYERHPPGYLLTVDDYQWGRLRRETLDLTVATLEAVHEHGHPTTTKATDTEVHARGQFVVQSIHPTTQETFVVGKEYLLTFGEVGEANGIQQ